jgi:hypothetical protein
MSDNNVIVNKLCSQHGLDVFLVCGKVQIYTV